MAVRAASWAFLGLLFATAASAGERPMAASPRAADSFPVATDARLGGDESQTRFVMDFTRKIDLHAFTLADPYRVVIDIPQVTFQLPPKTGESGRGLIKAFRFGLVMQGGSRLVFDLAKPARIEKAFVVDAADRSAGAAGARSGGDRSRKLFAPCCARQQLRPRPSRRSKAPERKGRRSASARRARSRPRRHRHRHQGAERRGGEGHRPRFRPAPARPHRENRQIPGADDAHRRHLRAARRPRAHRAQRRRRAVRLNSCRIRCRTARAMRRARASTRCRIPPPIRRPRGLPRRRTGPTSSPASI